MKITENCGTMKTSRAGLKDVWNAFMLDGAEFTGSDSHSVPQRQRNFPAILSLGTKPRQSTKSIESKKNLILSVMPLCAGIWMTINLMVPVEFGMIVILH